ncbi:MAG: hypothetical protein ACXVRE_07515 [Gaiellaceae bacterium]
MRPVGGQLAGLGAAVAASSLFAFVAVRAPARAQAVRTGTSIVGGTARERATVRAALAASSFDWGRLPGHVTSRIGAAGCCHASPGEIWLDRALLAHGRDSWGVIQHEYAHEADFFLLDARARTRLDHLLGGKTWWPNGRWRHDQYGAERFASTLAWSFWPSPHNTLIRYAHAEATAMPAARFRRVVNGLLAERRATVATGP